MSTTLRVLYDRKSPRHNWQIFVCLSSPEHESWIMGGVAARSRKWASEHGQREYEQGIATFDNPLYSQAPTTLPKSTKLVGVEKL